MVRRRIAGGRAILMYHRVAELPADPQLLAVRPEHFGEQIEVLRRHFRPVSLDDVVAGIGSGQLPGSAIAVTLDDGYADNLVHAKPLLEAFEVPAIAFVVSGAIGQQREFWWDELERLVLRPGRLPPELTLRVDGTMRHWRLGEAAEYSEEDWHRDRFWHVEQDRDPGPRQRLYRALYSVLHGMTDASKWSLLDELRRIGGVDLPGRSTHRAMAPDDLARLADGALISVGAHSATHPALGELPEDVQRDEIEGSKARLEELLDRPVTTFAYPHGSYSHLTVRAVRDAGFVAACSSDPVALRPASDLFRLPRIVPRDWDGDRFEDWLLGWIG